MMLVLYTMWSNDKCKLSMYVMSECCSTAVKRVLNTTWWPDIPPSTVSRLCYNWPTHSLLYSCVIMAQQEWTTCLLMQLWEVSSIVMIWLPAVSAYINVHDNKWLLSPFTLLLMLTYTHPVTPTQRTDTYIDNNLSLLWLLATAYCNYWLAVFFKDRWTSSYILAHICWLWAASIIVI